uniref:Uncharacterized protein n=1 Tax=Aceria tosichella TaxID=561515 RepID=A0A6G1S5D3_9ACAR
MRPSFELRSSPGISRKFSCRQSVVKVGVAILIAIVANALETIQEEEPPFPQPVSLNQERFKIISEIIDENDVAARTQEEFVDLKRGLASFVTSTSTGHYVRHLNAEESLCFTYRPYKCVVQQMSDIAPTATSGGGKRTPELTAIIGAEQELSGYNVETLVNLVNDDTEDMWGAPGSGSGATGAAPAKQTKQRSLLLFGVSGLWLMASQKPKTFTKSTIVYSASTDAYRPSLVWKMIDGDLEIEFYFVDSKPAAAPATNANPQQQASTPILVSAPAPTLEMIKISSTKKKSLLRTINILSIERTLPAEIYDEILSVPLGYGCFSSLLDAYANDSTDMEFVELIRARRAYANRHAIDAVGNAWMGRVELEVTATKAVISSADGSSSMPTSRSSDTFSLELAQTVLSGGVTIKGIQEGPYAKLIRWRNSREDRKLVMNQLLRIKYNIDMLRGSCQLEHWAQAPKNIATGDEQEPVLIKFANGAEFDANMELFDESDDLHFIKVTSGGSGSNGRRLHHYEGTAATKQLISWLKTSTGVSEQEAKRTRVVRSYSVDGDTMRLASITIWLLDEQEANIVESYQVYVIDMRDEDGTELAEDRAKQFDVSYECYLENEHMVQNRDYAWFQLSYPASQQVLSLAAHNSETIKQRYFESGLVDDIIRQPRVELLLEEDRLKLRALVIDLPPVELMYDKISQMLLVTTTSTSAINRNIQVYMEPDLRHCGHQCRKYGCTIMSYCNRAKSCTISLKPGCDFELSVLDKLDSTDSRTLPYGLTRNNDCNTYTIPNWFKQDELHKRSRLSSVLSRLRHQNYNDRAELPPAPEEVTMSQSDSGLSDEEYVRARVEYTEHVRLALEKDNRLPELVFSIRLHDSFLFLIPNKFELENDPLSEFGLEHIASSDGLVGDDDDDQPQRVPQFHKGLTMNRLNIARHHPAQLVFHSFRGLSYDQCALACWDSKCGIFSYCEQGGECILSSAKTIGEAQQYSLIETAPDCLVAQRDFLGNFVKYPSVYRPQMYKSRSTEPVLDPSECALKCIAETDYHCLSFQFCPSVEGMGGESSSSSSSSAAAGGNDMAPGPSYQCYYQATHHLLSEETSSAGNTGCDHYARSQLADYVRVDSSRVRPNILDQLKTSVYTDLSVFDCASKCSNELLDCTAFQFCIHPYGDDDGNEGASFSHLPVHECVTIESKITPSMLGNSSSSSHETIVDETKDASGLNIQMGDYMTLELDCQVFAMRKDSSQAHLRDLAFGGLIRTTSEKTNDEHLDTGKPSIFGAIMLYLTVATLTTAATCATVILSSKSEYVRQRVERIRILMRV